MQGEKINKIGDIFRALREEKGLRQDDLAEMLNVKRQTYSAWERGISSPDINTIIFLADFYKVDTDYLLGRTKVKNSALRYREEPNAFRQIEDLSEESVKELKRYAHLLKLKEEVDKSKDEISSAWVKNA